MSNKHYIKRLKRIQKRSTPILKKPLRPHQEAVLKVLQDNPVLEIMPNVYWRPLKTHCRRNPEVAISVIKEYPT